MEKKNIDYDSFVKILRKMNEDGEDERNALYYLFLIACEQENLIICNAILEAGFNINYSTTGIPQTVLDLLISRRTLTYKMADWLIENNINTAGSRFFSYKSSPAISACEKGDFELAKYLASKKEYDFGSKEKELYFSIITQNYQMVKDYTKRDKKLVNTDFYLECKHMYPIHLAILSGNVEIARLLLENEANVNETIKDLHIVANYDGATFPLDLAITKKDTAMQELLKEFGGKASSKVDRIRAINSIDVRNFSYLPLMANKDKIIKRILEYY